MYLCVPHTCTHNLFIMGGGAIMIHNVALTNWRNYQVGAKKYLDFETKWGILYYLAWKRSVQKMLNLDFVTMHVVVSENAPFLGIT